MVIHIVYPSVLSRFCLMSQYAYLFKGQQILHKYQNVCYKVFLSLSIIYLFYANNEMKAMLHFLITFCRSNLQILPFTLGSLYVHQCVQENDVYDNDKLRFTRYITFSFM